MVYHISKVQFTGDSHDFTSVIEMTPKWKGLNRQNNKDIQRV